MTEKRFKYIRDTECIYDNGEEFTHIDMCAYANAEAIVKLLNALHEENQQLQKENEQLKELLKIIGDADSVRSENSVKEILRNNLFALDTVTGESPNAFNEYCILNNFFKEHYNEFWDNDKYD